MGYPHPYFCLCAFLGALSVCPVEGGEPQNFRLRGSMWEFPKIGGTLFWDPYIKDPTI